MKGEVDQMKSSTFIDNFFLPNPFQRGMVELGILFGTRICRLVFSWMKFSIFPVSNIFGGLLILLSLAFHLLTIIHWIITSLKEEKILLQRFPHEYKQYMQDVRWRMIPGVI
jgi:protein-S-isoprenylcysteine O-methyltransferase Ste14